MIDLRIATLVPSPGTDLREFRYRGEDCMRVARSPDVGPSDGVALVADLVFGDGAIELTVASELAEGAGQMARGFVGLVFRAGDDGSTFDKFYLRPTNARADDQVRRNHSVQYACEPQWPWQRLRSETPEKYESYTDMEMGAWTAMRVEVAAEAARLYVNRNEHPSLIVDDLKGQKEGRVGLWIGPGTIGYFRQLDVT